MATITRAQLAAKVLENLGVKAAGQAASAEDTQTVLDAINGCYSDLRRHGKAPFDDDAVPEWAQSPLRDLVSFDVKDVFGLTGERLQSLMASYNVALAKLARNTAGKHDPRIRVKAKYY